MRPNRRMPGTQRPAKQETPMSDHRESPAFRCGEEVNTPLTALRGRGLVALSRRRDDLSGTAYCLTDEGCAAPRT